MVGTTPVLVHNSDAGDSDPFAELRKTWDPGNANDDGYNAPTDREEQDKEFRRAIKTIQRDVGRALTKAEERKLHDEITKRGCDYNRIVEEGRSLFKGC
ncbi:hypothetical protein GCM10009612_59690 [Streptomyces beijiangensis]